MPYILTTNTAEIDDLVREIEMCQQKCIKSRESTVGMMHGSNEGGGLDATTADQHVQTNRHGYVNGSA